MASTATLAELEQARRRLDEPLKQEQAELRRAKRCATVEAQAWVLPLYLRSVAVATYHLAGDAEPAVKYLAARGRERHWPVRADSDLATLVEDLYLAASPDEIAALTSTSSPADGGVLAVVLKLVTDWQVVAWARRGNSATGVVPTPSLLQHKEELRQALPEPVRPPSVGASSERRAKRWVARLRRRWGGRYTKIPLAEHVEPAELSAKATRAKPTCTPRQAPEAHGPRAPRGGVG